jgi:cyclopropane-fatty-acyl-phospholipid synthase
VAELQPFYQNVQAHYDLSDDFFAIFLDPSRTYSCAYFERDDMSLAEAQAAKIDLSLGKCDLKPGMRLLDIGCGWGACARRAAEKYAVHAIGLTLSRNQHAYCTQQARENPPARGSLEFRLMGWEEFQEPVDRIVSIGAFEHFRRERYDVFFDRCREILPRDGRMLLHTIVAFLASTLERMGVPVEHENILFAKFIMKEIFPGGDLCEPTTVIAHAEKGGFKVIQTQSLQSHYARTLDHWAAALEAQREGAIALTSEEVYQRYMKYLTGCAKHFRSRHIDVVQFTLQK